MSRDGLAEEVNPVGMQGRVSRRRMEPARCSQGEGESGRENSRPAPAGPVSHRRGIWSYSKWEEATEGAGQGTEGHLACVLKQRLWLH